MLRALLIAAAHPLAASSPQPSSSPGHLNLTAPGNSSLNHLDSSGAAKGESFNINIFINNLISGPNQKPDCTATPDTSVAVDSGCSSVYTQFGLGIWIKLGTDATDKSITAQIYAPATDCTGTPVFGGGTPLKCGECYGEKFLNGGFAVQFECPFGAMGLCNAAGIELGRPCMEACAVGFVVLVAACFVGSFVFKRRGTRQMQPAVVYVQAQQPLMYGQQNSGMTTQQMYGR